MSILSTTYRSPLERVVRGGSVCRARWHDERGVALVIALMSMILMLGLGLALVLTTTTETMITGNYRGGSEAMYAADAGVERAMQDLLTVLDWNTILSGAETSAFIDGDPSGTRTMSDGSTIDLTQATNVLNCGKVTTCSTSDMNAYTEERPWTTNNPRWQLYSYGPMTGMLTGGATATIDSRMYVVVWVADDSSENDDDPTVDGASQANPGSGVLSMRAEAFGPGGIHKVIETTVMRTDSGVGQAGVRILSWRELR